MFGEIGDAVQKAIDDAAKKAAEKAAATKKAQNPGPVYVPPVPNSPAPPAGLPLPAVEEPEEARFWGVPIPTAKKAAIGLAIAVAVGSTVAAFLPSGKKARR